MMVAELRWDQLGGLLGPRFASQRELAIRGEVELDLGYGPLRLPLFPPSVRLP